MSNNGTLPAERPSSNFRIQGPGVQAETEVSSEVAVGFTGVLVGGLLVVAVILALGAVMNSGSGGDE